MTCCHSVVHGCPACDVMPCCTHTYCCQKEKGRCNCLKLMWWTFWALSLAQHYHRNSNLLSSDGAMGIASEAIKNILNFQDVAGGYEVAVKLREWDGKTLYWRDHVVCFFVILSLCECDDSVGVRRKEEKENKSGFNGLELFGEKKKWKNTCKGRGTKSPEEVCCWKETNKLSKYGLWYYRSCPLAYSFPTLFQIVECNACCGRNIVVVAASDHNGHNIVPQWSQYCTTMAATIAIDLKLFFSIKL